MWRPVERYTGWGIDLSERFGLKKSTGERFKRWLTNRFVGLHIDLPWKLDSGLFRLSGSGLGSLGLQRLTKLLGLTWSQPQQLKPTHHWDRPKEGPKTSVEPNWYCYYDWEFLLSKGNSEYRSGRSSLHWNGQLLDIIFSVDLYTFRLPTLFSLGHNTYAHLYSKILWCLSIETKTDIFGSQIHIFIFDSVPNFFWSRASSRIKTKVLEWIDAITTLEIMRIHIRKLVLDLYVTNTN